MPFRISFWTKWSKLPYRLVFLLPTNDIHEINHLTIRYKKNRNKWILPFVNRYCDMKDGIFRIKSWNIITRIINCHAMNKFELHIEKSPIIFVFVDFNIVQYWIRWIAGNSFPLIISCIRYIEYSRMLLVFVYAARPTIKSWQCH